eukprot:403355743
MMGLSEKEKQNALNEVRILASIQNINIISYKESFYEDATSTLCIIMEYADGGDLYNKIVSFKKQGKYMPEKEVWHIFIQIIRGLQALHELKIVHRDIKCANLFLTKDGCLKLGDLNVSKVAKRGMLQTQTGTPYYASPEVWKDKPYDSKSDIWSVGCVLYEMCALNPPFRAQDMNALCQKICKGIYPPIPATYSQDLVAMIKCLLLQNPSQRPTCAQILQMTGTQNHLSATLQRMESIIEESKEGLIGTIKVPRNLGQITERLPKPQYNSNPVQLKRNSSEPGRIGQPLGAIRENLQSAKPSNAYDGLRGLAPIKERDEARSADPARDIHTKNNNPLYYQYRMKNQAKGYVEEKENNNVRLPKINDKSYLQNRGAAILASGQNRYKAPDVVNQSNIAPPTNQRVLNQIYGGNNHAGMPTHAQKPPMYNNNNKYQYNNNNGYVDRSNVNSVLEPSHRRQQYNPQNRYVL